MFNNIYKKIIICGDTSSVDTSSNGEDQIYLANTIGAYVCNMLDQSL